jgi:hypothetical protein
MREDAEYDFDGQNEVWLAGCPSYNAFGNSMTTAYQNQSNQNRLGEVGWRMVTRLQCRDQSAVGNGYGYYHHKQMT